MEVRMTVTFDQKHGGDQYVITSDTRDILAWEKAGPNRAAGQVVGVTALTTFRVDDLYSLAFATMRRQDLWQGSEKELRDNAVIDLGHPYTPSVEDAPELEDDGQEGEEQDPPTQLARSSGE